MYELDANGQPNFEAPNVTTTRASSKPLDGLFGGKGDNRRKWFIIGAIVVVVVLAIVIVGAAVGSTGGYLLLAVINFKSDTNTDVFFFPIFCYSVSMLLVSAPQTGLAMYLP